MIYNNFTQMEIPLLFFISILKYNIMYISDSQNVWDMWTQRVILNTMLHVLMLCLEGVHCFLAFQICKHASFFYILQNKKQEILMDRLQHVFVSFTKSSAT